MYCAQISGYWTGSIPEEADVVAVSGYPACPVPAAGPDGFAPDLRHDAALTSQILVAEAIHNNHLHH